MSFVLRLTFDEAPSSLVNLNSNSLTVRTISCAVLCLFRPNKKAIALLSPYQTTHFSNVSMIH